MNRASHCIVILPVALSYTLITGCAISSNELAPEPSAATLPVIRSADSPETFSGSAKIIVDWAGGISGAVGTVQAGIGAATVIGQLLGIIDSTDPNKDILNQLHLLSTQIDNVSKAINWHIDETTREMRLSSLRAAIDVAHDKIAKGEQVDWFAIDLDTHTALREASGLDGLGAYLRQYVDSDTDGSAGYINPSVSDLENPHPVHSFGSASRQ